MGFVEVPQRKVGNKTQEWFPFWSTASHLQRCMICKCMASLVLLHKFTVIQRVSRNIVFHIHKMKELIFKIQYSHHVIIHAWVVLFHLRGESKRWRGSTAEVCAYKSNTCLHPHLFSNTGRVMDDTTQQGHDGNGQPTLEASQRGLTAGYHTHCLCAMCFTLCSLLSITTQTKQAWNKCHFSR